VRRMRAVTKAAIYVLITGLVVMFAFYIGRNAAHPLKDMQAVGPQGTEAKPGVRLSDIHDSRVINVAVDGKIVRMGLEEYVLGVVAAEMPASFEPEALKAQAVAARTYAVRSILYGGCSKYPGADVCDEPGHCQGYCTADEMMEKWKDGYDGYHAKIESAVAETAGKIVAYRGEPILVLYHASSAGYTEDVENVFAQSLPYLRGVSTDDGDVTDLTRTEEYDRAWFCDEVNGQWPKAKLSSGVLEAQVTVESRFPSGRVNTVKLGGVSVEATELRKLVDLRSTNFTLSYNQHSIVFTTEGNGHGVGMSQYGAQAMAKEGRGYVEILEHYYTGVDIVDMNP
jgi:stage II sporulation protein D